MIVALVLLVGLSAGLGFLLWHRSSHGLIASRLRSRVLVTLKTGEAFSGLLYATDGEAIVLREATAVAFGSRAENVPVEGEALILRCDIAYMQLP